MSVVPFGSGTFLILIKCLFKNLFDFLKKRVYLCVLELFNAIDARNAMVFAKKT